MLLEKVYLILFCLFCVNIESDQLTVKGVLCIIAWCSLEYCNINAVFAFYHSSLNLHIVFKKIYKFYDCIDKDPREMFVHRDITHVLPESQMRGHWFRRRPFVGEVKWPSMKFLRTTWLNA